MEDCAFALASLFDVLFTVCKVMAPFTPFLTERMYLNLKKSVPEDGLQDSVHFCDYPEAAALHEGDERIQTSVERMQRVVELGRKIRAQKNIPVKMPIHKLIVVHPDNEFLSDVAGDLPA